MRWLCFLHASILAGFLQFATQDPRVSAAELNESQQLLVKQVNEAIVAAGKSYASGDFEESGQQIIVAMERLSLIHI